MSKPKQLSTAIIREEVKLYDESVEIPLLVDNQEYQVKLYPYFKLEKIRDLATEMSEFAVAAKEEGVDLSSLTDDDILSYYILRTFTDIKMTGSKKPKTIYSDIKTVLNSRAMREIYSQFPKESLEEVYQFVFDVVEAAAKLERRKKNMADEIKNLPLANEEVMKLLEQKMEADNAQEAVGEVNE